MNQRKGGNHREVQSHYNENKSTKVHKYRYNEVSLKVQKYKVQKKYIFQYKKSTKSTVQLQLFSWDLGHLNAFYANFIQEWYLS